MAVCGNYDIPVNAVMDEVEEGGWCMHMKPNIPIEEVV
jgi:hypothetical protein